MNREKFALLKNVVYLDSAAAALKPTEVIDAINDFYTNYPISNHSSDSRLGVLVEQKISESRKLVADLVGAASEEVIFTSGTTDSLNKIALMLESKINEGDEILLSHLNHSSNVIPWMEVARRKKAKIIYSTDLLSDINGKTKIIAYAQTNNTLDEKYDPKAIFAKAKQVNALVVNDAAQAIIHSGVLLSEADVIVFSGNKLYGPTGIGALIVRKKLLDTLEPVTYGGGSVSEINDDSWIKKDGVDKYEPGTLHTAGIIGLGAAIKYKNALGDVWMHEKQIADYAFDKLQEVNGIRIYSNRGDLVILFNIGEFSSQDVVSHLGHKDIILRAGEHCARATSDSLGFKSSIRLSIGHYNNKDDIDKMIDVLKNGGDFLEFI